jgi:hypothetical protein
MTNRPAGGARDPHTGHDREAIAAYAAGDAAAAARVRAEFLIRDCEGCARLVDDLRAIAAATRQLPAPIAIARDFRLSAADAARLRGGPWRRIAGALGLPAWNPRPFAAALTTLGVAGLLIAVLPFMSLGSAGSAAAPEAAGSASDQKAVFGAGGGLYAASPAASPAATAGPSAGVPAAVYSSAARSLDLRDSFVPEDLSVTPAPTTDTTPAPAPEPPRQQAPGSPLVFLSLGLIAAGGALFALGRGPRGGR